MYLVAQNSMDPVPPPPFSAAKTFPCCNLGKSENPTGKLFFSIIKRLHLIIGTCLVILFVKLILNDFPLFSLPPGSFLIISHYSVVNFHYCMQTDVTSQLLSLTH